MSDAIGGMGIVLKRGDGATPTEAFTAVAEVRNMSGIGVELGTWDATVHSRTDFYTKLKAGLKTLKPITIEVNWIPTNVTHKNASGGLLYEIDQRREGNWQIVFPDSGSTTWTFEALVTDIDIEAPTPEGLMGSITLTPTGDSITLT